MSSTNSSPARKSYAEALAQKAAPAATALVRASYEGYRIPKLNTVYDVMTPKAMKTATEKGGISKRMEENGARGPVKDVTNRGHNRKAAYKYKTVSREILNRRKRVVIRQYRPTRKVTAKRHLRYNVKKTTRIPEINNTCKVIKPAQAKLDTESFMTRFCQESGATPLTKTKNIPAKVIVPNTDNKLAKSGHRHEQEGVSELNTISTQNAHQEPNSAESEGNCEEYTITMATTETPLQPSRASSEGSASPQGSPVAEPSEKEDTTVEKLPLKKHGYKMTARQIQRAESKTNKNNQALYIIPDSEAIIATKTEETMFTGHVTVPASRATKCPLCKFISTGHTTKTALTTVLMHIKLKHKYKDVEYGYVCRNCNKMQEPVTIGRGGQGLDQKRWIKAHSTECFNISQKATREKTKGRYMCYACGTRFYHGLALQSHIENHCSKKNDSDSDTEWVKATEQNRRSNDQSTPKAPDSTLTIDTSTKQKYWPISEFDCLRKYDNTEAWLTDKVIDFALSHITKEEDEVKYISAALWPLMKTEPRNSTALPRRLITSETTIIPIAEKEHWSVIVIERTAENKLLGRYLDPLQIPGIPSTIIETVEKHLDLEWYSPEYETNKLPKQAEDDNVNCGIYIIRYASEFVNKNALRIDNPKTLRNQLCRIYERIELDEVQKLMDLRLETPTKFCKPTIVKLNDQQYEPIRAKILKWAADKTKEYSEKDGRFNVLEAFVDRRGKIIAHSTRNRLDKMETEMKYDLPEPEEERKIVDGVKISNTSYIQTEPMKNKKRRAAHKYNQFQSDLLYWPNRKKIYNNIIMNVSKMCKIPSTQLYDAFDKRTQKPEVNPGILDTATRVLPKLNIPDNFMDAFTLTEVQHIIKSLPSDSTAGPDGITYTEWRKIDKEGRIIHWICNEVKHHGRIPDSWRESKTRLLHKKGDEYDTNNWRPITLLRTIYKIYTRLWNERITKIKDIYSEVQKGFTTFHGTLEHAMLLRGAIDYAVRNKKPLALTWLDLTDAFGSVPFEVILKVLEKAGFPDEFIDIINDLYTDCSTSIMTEDGDTDPIKLLCGTKQGDPISPTLFNLVIEILIKNHMARAEGFQFIDHNLKIIAFADDIVILSTRPQKLQNDLNAIIKIGKGLKLRFNAKKCASLTIDEIYGLPTKDKISIEDKAIPTLRKNDFYKYLGTNIGAYNMIDLTEISQQINDQGLSVANSSYTTPEKIDMIKTFVLSKLTHILSTSTPQLKELIRLDNQVGMLLKHTLNIPFYAPKEYLHIPKEKGGLGITPVLELAYISTINSFLKCCWSNCEDTRNDTVKALLSSIRTLKNNDKLTLVEVLNILATESSIDKIQRHLPSETYRIWQLIEYFQNPANGLFKKFHIIIHENTIALLTQTQDTSTPILFTYDKADTITKKLKKTVAEQTFEKWSTSGSFRSTGMPALSASPWSSGYMKMQHWKYQIKETTQEFIHSAKLEVLTRIRNWRFLGNGDIPDPCKHCTDKETIRTWGNSSNTKEQRLKEWKHQETLGHILNHCKKRQEITDRHNAAADILKQAALNQVGMCLAKDLEKENIIVAQFCPGWVQTDMGGPNGQITVDESADALYDSIQKLTLEHSGYYFDRNLKKYSF